MYQRCMRKSKWSWMENLILLLKVIPSVINYLIFFLPNRTKEKYYYMPLMVCISCLRTDFRPLLFLRQRWT